MAESFRAQLFLIKDALLVELCWMMRLLASSWILLCTSYFGLISFLRALCIERIDLDGGCAEKLGPCEELCGKKGRDEKKAGKLLDERTGHHKFNEDFQEDNASLPVQGFRHATDEPEVIDFTFNCQTESEIDSTVNAEMKAFREKSRMDEAFSSNTNGINYFPKLQSSFNGRFLKVGDIGSPKASLDVNVEGNGDSPTNFSSSVGSNCDMFSEGDTSESSFEEDDFLTEEDFIRVKPRPISDYLSLAHDLCEECKSSNCENSAEKVLEFSSELLGAKDEAYERLEVLSVHAPPLLASEKQSEEEDDDDDEISIGSKILEASDLASELVEALNAKECCGFIMQSNQNSPDHVVEYDAQSSEEESTTHGYDSQKKQIFQDQILNPTMDNNHASTNTCDSFQYRGAHDESSPGNQEQSTQVALQRDHPEPTVNHEDENHLIVGQAEDSVNHVSDGPLKSTSSQNDCIIHDLLKTKDTNDGTPDQLIEPHDSNPQYSISLGENNDNDLPNNAGSLSEHGGERRQYEDQEEEEDDDGLEALLEHQKMVENLKMEMRRARGRGLPTILEELEWPKEMDDLKQLKMEDIKLMAAAKELPLDEMQRFYKSYRDKMRKLDILNHQKTSSIGFLKLTDPIQSGSALWAAIPALTSVVWQNFRRSGAQEPQVRPSAEFMRELRIDMETVYVGQVCLSWEYLHWQYTRFRDMLDAEADYGGNFRRATDEFQTFLVLLTRFIEDEKFKGPRVDNYVKNRCVQRSLLQVPLIKEEKAFKIEGKEDTSVDELVQTMEECLRTFWDFVRRDRDEVGTILKSLIGSQTELQDPSDAELFANIQASLQKKEKRLKDLHRTGNCLVKRFQKQQQGGWMDESVFFSLVDMRLVGRVLKMSRVSSDHLEWCHRKLDKVSFRGRKLVRDPSFLPFPC